MGWGTAFKVAYKVASTTAKVAYDTYKAVTYVQDKVADAAVATKDAVVAGAVATKDAVVAGAVATKDAAVWAKDKAVEGAIAAKDAAVAGAVAAKDAVVAGAVAAKDAVRAKTISAREQQIRNAYGTAHENLSQEVAGCPAQECPFKKAECARLAEAKDKAILADHVYMDQGKADDEKHKAYLESEMAKSGIRPLDLQEDRAELQKFLGVDNPEEYLQPKGQNFRARVYAKRRPDGSDEFIVSFRGTQPESKILDNFKKGADVKADIDQAVGFDTPHYQKASEIADLIRAKNGDNAPVSFTGHSLGGGLASAAAYKSGYPASTYNAAGLNMKTVIGADPKRAGPVNAYFNAADPLNAVQDNRRVALYGISELVGAIPVIGQALNLPLKAWIVKNEVTGTPHLPQAYGQRRPLPLPQRSKPPGLGEGHGMGLLLEGIDIQRSQLGCQ